MTKVTTITMKVVAASAPGRHCRVPPFLATALEPHQREGRQQQRILNTYGIVTCPIPLEVGLPDGPTVGVGPVLASDTPRKQYQVSRCHYYHTGDARTADRQMTPSDRFAAL